MNEKQMKALKVGPTDTLFISISSDSFDNDQIRNFQKQLIKQRPDLKDRVVIIAAEDVEMKIVSGKDEKRSMKGVC